MCDFKQELLHEYIDGELNALETMLLEEHLKECPACRRELNQLKILDWNMRFADRIIPPNNRLENLRKSTIDYCFTEFLPGENGNKISDAYKAQANAIKLAVSYLEFLPGTTVIETVGKATGNYLGKKLSIRQIIKGLSG